ncbi:hypothetical protein Syun_027756 [Stephania yunnanensis]|uniref:Uncharacterized protein n=1 Tax=Stephania yunnanensis TaxID=152371 RepID=A0AAP0EG50_9MAGN
MLIEGRAPKTEVRRTIPQGSKHEVLTAEKEPFVDIFSESQEDLITENVPEISEDGFTKSEPSCEFVVEAPFSSRSDWVPVRLFVYGGREGSVDTATPAIGSTFTNFMPWVQPQGFCPGSALDATALVDVVLILNNAPYGAVIKCTLELICEQLF